MIELPQALFNIYALSLPRGLGFGEDLPQRAWRSDDQLTCGVLTENVRTGAWGVLMMRRREDDVWMVTRREHGMASEESARTLLESLTGNNKPREAIPPGVARRPPLWDVEDRTPSKIFECLEAPTHHVAASMLNQLYLAFPRPDPNWARDCQTANFHTALGGALADLLS